ncbi:dihydropteroate synthase [bacterium]|nr:dihydropteroate synthase [bacterium]
MGVVNTTPDSFSDGGRWAHSDIACRHIDTLVADGAECIDIGAESTRPGAVEIPADVQIERLGTALRHALSIPNIWVSVDTRSAAVAEYSLSLGAHAINDVSMLRHDPEMASVVAQHGAVLMITHSRDTPQLMQISPHYTDPVADTLRELRSAIQAATQAGVSRCVIDPGIGFAKTLADNIAILRNLSQFRSLGYPTMIGTSRKSFIGELTGAPVDQRLPGSLVSMLWAIHQGVSIVRVHDVAETVQALRVWQALGNTPG